MIFLAGVFQFFNEPRIPCKKTMVLSISRAASDGEWCDVWACVRCEGVGQCFARECYGVSSLFRC